MSRRKSPSLPLVAVLRAFLGDVEAATAIVGNALSIAVATMAQHGTRGPVDEACKMLGELTGRSVKEKALQAGYAAVKGDLQGIVPGKSDGATALDLGERIGAAFVLAVGEVLTAPTDRAEVTPAVMLERIARKVAKVKDADLRDFLVTQSGRDMFARVTALQAAIDASQSAKEAARKARAPVDKPASVPAVGAPVGEPVKVAA